MAPAKIAKMAAAPFFNARQSSFFRRKKIANSPSSDLGIAHAAFLRSSERVQDSISRQKILSSWTTRSSLLNSGAARRLKVQTYGGGRGGGGLEPCMLNRSNHEISSFPANLGLGSFVRSASSSLISIDHYPHAKEKEKRRPGSGATYVDFPFSFLFFLAKSAPTEFAKLKAEKEEKREGGDKTYWRVGVADFSPFER